MKMIKLLLSLAITTLIIVACGTAPANESNNGNTNGAQPITEGEPTESPEENGYIVHLQAKENDHGAYIFSIKNISNEPLKLVFPTSQEIDYALKDDTGETLYQYGYEFSFAQVITERTIAPHETYEAEITIQDVVKYLEKTPANLHVWLTAINLYASMDIEIE